MDTDFSSIEPSNDLPALAGNDAKCDVVIVNYNAGVLLLNCVVSLPSESVARIIVVDNDSSDGSLEPLIALADDKLVIIRNGKNLGFSAGCNIGAKASSADRVLFLNPDCVVAADALAKLTAVLESADDVGMVGGFLANPDGTEQRGGRLFFPTPKRAFMRAFGFHKLSHFFPKARLDFSLHQTLLPTQPTPVEAISGACMMVKRKSFEQVGLWDEGYFLHCEDLDWCMRFRKNQLKILFVPDAKVTHAWGACSKSRPFFVEWHKHRGMLRFYKKFFKSSYPAPLWLLVVLGVWTRCSLVFAFYGMKILGQKARGQRG